MHMWTVERILSFTTPVGDCLEWTRCLNTDGYPRLYPNIKVHRLLYKLLHGVDIEGLVVRHTCDNPKCLKPEHLVEGTALENVQDRVKRDRTYRTITKEFVDDIKLFPDTCTNKEIAEVVGIDHRRVSEIRSGKRDETGRMRKKAAPAAGGVIFVA